MAEHMTRDEFDRRHPTPLIEKDQHQQFLPAGALDFSTVRRVTLRSRLRRLGRRLAAFSGSVTPPGDDGPPTQEAEDHGTVAP